MLKDFATLHRSVQSMDALLRDECRTTFSGPRRERLPVQFRTESENTDWKSQQKGFHRPLCAVLHSSWPLCIEITLMQIIGAAFACPTPWIQNK
jgi:hypothetical protein